MLSIWTFRRTPRQRVAFVVPRALSTGKSTECDEICGPSSAILSQGQIFLTIAAQEWTSFGFFERAGE